ILVSPVKVHRRQEEIQAAITEGVELETLVSPTKIHSQGGRLTGVDCIRNRLGDVDAGGRRTPVPMPGTEFRTALDTLIVAVGEKPASECLHAMGLETDRNGRAKVNPRSLQTSLPGVFAGGDLVTGPNTVVDAIAAGKKAVESIDRHLRGEAPAPPASPHLPDVFVQRLEVPEQEAAQARRQTPPVLPVPARAKNFREVEMTLSEEQARAEARRCLRCDLAFTEHLCPHAAEAVPGGNGKP
ncbi:MAG: FAD-dependent oxidoreductase, partial [Lentisphaeria bacterium]|nr:FAD-dependent oxidoreductase [Lentisphaeria bacterium]